MGIILLVVFLLTVIGIIAYVNYDYQKTIKEINEESYRRKMEIIKEGTERLKELVNK